MTIKAQAMGDYQTNCYIVTIDGKDLIIDPGMGATQWVLDNTTNPIAILNTHGHFDHVWSNKELNNKLRVPIYCPQDDCFMLEDDPFDQGTPTSIADFKVKPDEIINIDGIEVKFHHFPGHTPGCSAITINDTMFSGDFIFEGSIGRVDFPYSSPEDMKDSIRKVLEFDQDYTIYTGHGAPTSLFTQKVSLNNWLNYL